jgi:hypothetical protein
MSDYSPVWLAAYCAVELTNRSAVKDYNAVRSQLKEKMSFFPVSACSCRLVTPNGIRERFAFIMITRCCEDRVRDSGALQQPFKSLV